LLHSKAEMILEHSSIMTDLQYAASNPAA